MTTIRVPVSWLLLAAGTLAGIGWVGIRRELRWRERWGAAEQQLIVLAERSSATMRLRDSLERRIRILAHEAQALKRREDDALSEADRLAAERARLENAYDSLSAVAVDSAMRVQRLVADVAGREVQACRVAVASCRARADSLGALLAATRQQLAAVDSLLNDSRRLADRYRSLAKPPSPWAIGVVAGYGIVWARRTAFVPGDGFFVGLGVRFFAWPR